MKLSLVILFGLSILISCEAQNKNEETKAMKFKVEKTEQEWKEILTPEQYYVLREKGTERPFTGEYNMLFNDGTYSCAACKAPLFTSDSKFDSHCGWPSFDSAIADSAIVEKKDVSHGMVRTEIMCGTCGGHLGHVFNDGPTTTGLRYCVNSLSVKFEDDEKNISEK